MPDLGRAALVVCLGLCAYAVAAGALAATRRRRRLAVSAQNALVAAFPVTLIAAIILLVALGRRDMTFVYVWQHTSHKLPLGYALSAFWGGQEGSLLLWLLVLTGLGTAAVLLNKGLIRQLLPWTVPVLGGIAAFFALVLTFVASPFARQIAPADGSGLTPSLQNPYMMIHPPLLYLGYVGMTIPFAFAAGALLSGRTDERWIIATRRWTLLAWTALGIGILLGAKWAYEEVGWGGYYGWDPVENAAATQMKPRNQGPIEDCAKLWIELRTPLRVKKVPNRDRQNASETRTTFQTRSMFFFSCTITECRKAVEASHGISAAFSTGSQP